MAQKMSAKRKAFIHFFVKYRNAAKAAKEAGYDASNQHMFGVIGYKLLQDPKIQELIKAEMEAIAIECKLDTTRVLQEYIKIAFASIGDIATFDASGVTIRASKDLDQSTLDAIQEITHSKRGRDVDIKIKMHDKLKALDALAKFVKLFGNGDGEGDEPILNLIKALNESRTRIAEEGSEAEEESTDGK